jgi:hypothetical protein
MNKFQKARRALDRFARGMGITPAGLARAIRNAEHETKQVRFADITPNALRNAEIAVKLAAEQRKRLDENSAPTVQGATRDVPERSAGRGGGE